MNIKEIFKGIHWVEPKQLAIRFILVMLFASLLTALSFAISLGAGVLLKLLENWL